MSIESGYTCTVRCLGDKEFFEKVGTPFADEIKKVIPRGPDKLPDIYPRSQLILNNVPVELFIGITVFIGAAGYAAGKKVIEVLGTKALEDVHTVLIQPRLMPLLEGFDAKLRNRRGQKSFNYSVWYEEFKVLVSVTMRADSYTEIALNAELIRKTHENALNWIRINGVKKPVHHYEIVGPYVFKEPKLLDNACGTLR